MPNNVTPFVLICKVWSRQLSAIVGSNPIFFAKSRRNCFLPLTVPHRPIAFLLLPKIGFAVNLVNITLTYLLYNIYTWRWAGSLIPISDDIFPTQVCSDSIQCGHFGFVGGDDESSMFEGDNISRLWIPSLCKLCCSCRRHKSNPIRPIEDGGLSRIQRKQESYARNLHFAFPGARTCASYDFGFSVSIFLFVLLIQFSLR